MGCFGSRIRLEDEGNRPTERSHLLPHQDTHTGDALASAARQSMGLTQVEQDVYRRIVEQTAETLIDISGTHTIERLQPEEAQERSEEYMRLLQQGKPADLKRQRSLYRRPVSGVPSAGALQALTPAALIEGLRRAESAYSPSQREADLALMKTVSAQVQEALVDFKIKDVSPFVITLPSVK